MFDSIRRHQKWLWVIIIVVVIISFVVFFNPSTQMGGGYQETDFGSINGRKITREAYLAANQEAEINYLFRTGEWPGGSEFTRQNFDGEQQTMSRLLLIDKIAEFGLEATDESVANWIKTQPVFRDRNTLAYNPAAFNQFISQVLPQSKARISARDFYRFVRHEIGIQQMITTVGAGGKLVTPAEAETAYRQLNEQVNAQVALLSVSNYLSAVQVTEDKLSTFYTNRIALYRLPERVQVAYVEFSQTNYYLEVDQLLAANTNLNAMLDQFYLQRGPANFTDATGAVMVPEVAKLKIKSDLRDEQALLLARRDAAKFAAEAQDPAAVGTVSAEGFEKLAAAKGFITRTSAPFDRNTGPVDMDVLHTFTETAFALTKEEPISSPLPDQSAVFVIALKNRLPSEMPIYETVKAKVTDDYRRSQAEEMARMAGTAFRASVTNGLAAGKSFESIVAEAKMEIINVPSFAKNVSTIPGLDSRLPVSLLRSVVSVLKAGEVSEYTPSFASDYGFVVHVKSFAPADEAKLKTELPEFISQLQQRRMFAAFEEWFSLQRKEANIVTRSDNVAAATAPTVPGAPTK